MSAIQSSRTAEELPVAVERELAVDDVGAAVGVAS